MLSSPCGKPIVVCFAGAMLEDDTAILGDLGVSSGCDLHAFESASCGAQHGERALNRRVESLEQKLAQATAQISALQAELSRDATRRREPASPQTPPMSPLTQPANVS